METLAEMLRAARAQSGMSQHALAIAIGSQAGLVSKWERGGIPDPRNVARLIAVLGMDQQAAWLAYGRAINESIEGL
jgi:transcriptional regulator with XRE-family HTH domain